MRASLPAGLLAFVLSAPALATPARPMDFVPNRGQWPEGVSYAAWHGTGGAALDPGGITLHARGAQPVRLAFEGSSPRVELQGEGARRGVYNFYVGDRPERWASRVPSFASVLYRGLHPGVDLRVREEDGRLAYDLLVSPGASAGTFVVRCEGATIGRVEKDGSLVLDTPAGPLRQSAPRTWSVAPDGTTHPLASRFRVLDTHRYGFEVDEPPRGHAVVVDPGIEWGTFLGGSGGDIVGGVAVARDGSGDVFLSGATVSGDFPLMDDPTFAPGTQSRVFVVRMDASGSSLVYATFLGGWHWQGVYRALAVNAAGEVAVAGETYSPDFPTTPGVVDRVAEGEEAYAFKLDALGGLVFSTFLGGRFYDSAWAVGFDPAGGVIVGGTTMSDDFPTTAGAYDRTYNVPNAPDQGGAHGDMFVARLSPDGKLLTYGTYLGGPSMDVLEDMAVDPSGQVVVTGWVTGNNVQTFVSTPGAFDSTWNGSQDGALARLKLAGTGAGDLLYATLLGGSSQDNLDGVAIDPANPALVTVVGDSWSGNFPTTAGVIKPTNPPFSDLFASQSGTITRFHLPTTGGGSLTWSSYLISPGPTGERATDVVVNGAGEAIVAGITDQHDFATQRGSLDRTLAGTRNASDAFLARINPTGTQVLYSTLLGGADGETDANMIPPLLAHVSGNTVMVATVVSSADMRTTVGALDPTHGGTEDTYVARLDLGHDAGGDVTAAPPALVAPANGAAFRGGGFVRLEWAPVNDPSGIEAYQYQLSGQPTFPPDSIHYQGSVSTTDAFLGPVASVTWYWRVRTADRAGNLSDWSPTRSFTLGSTGGRVTINSIGAFPSSVPGGSTATGVVWLDGIVPAGGLTIHLFVQNSRAYVGGESTPVPPGVSVPATVFVPAGATQVTFPITTSAVNATTNVDIMGTLDGIGRNGGFTVTVPATVTPVEVDTRPAALEGGTAATGTVKLGGAAPAGGAVVQLSSSHPALAQVPATIAVPAGSAQATFAITTAAVPTDVDVTIAASRAGVTSSNLLRLRRAGHPTLTSMTLTPTTVTSGAPVTGTVTFSGPVPDGIWPATWLAVVKVTSSDPDVAGVGGSYAFVEPPQSSGTFSVSTRGIPTTRTVTLTASFDDVALSAPLTLQGIPAPTFTSLTFQPSTVDSGTGGVGRVFIAAPAPQGGYHVPLTNGNPSVLTVPANVWIPTGSTDAMFAFTTSASLASQTTVTVTASFGTASTSGSVTVQPASARIPLAAISVSPTSVPGGTGATGTVTLSAPARPGGVVVVLSSYDPAVSVPASVTVPAGATSTTFPVTTSSVSTTVEAILSGLADNTGFSRTCGLTVTPGGATQPPATPTLISPANDARPAQPVLFDWSDAARATSYTIQIDDNSDFSSLVTSQTVTASQASIGNLPARRLFWRVRAHNSAGSSSWSTVRRVEPQPTASEPTLSSVSVSPSTVTGGNGSTGTVRLTSGAPAGGAIVSLSSSNTAAAQVPASVTVPQGSTSATFPVTTSPVGASTAVTITAVWKTDTRTTTLTVNPPPTLSSVSVSPSSVTGGSSSTGTVILTGAAPPGGAVVSLSSSNTAAARVPASVTVAQGATSATFTVTTSAVSSSTAVTITAVWKADTRTTVLTVNPASSGPLPAPSQLAPPHDARFAPGQSITFDWSDVAGATSYTLQIDDSDSFSAPLILEQRVTASTFTTSTLPTRTMWWRVRANDAAGAAGAWSAVRRFEVKD